MSFVVNGMVRGRENHPGGTAAGRENMSAGAAPPLQPKETAFLGTGVSTTIERTNEVATCTATAHGLSVGDVVRIAGADQVQYNGDKRVDSVADANTFTFAVYGSPTASATGTITSKKHMK